MLSKTQFEDWLADFMRFFPDLESYHTRLSDEQKTEDGWYRTLQRFDLVVLAQVTDRMLDGKVAPLQAHEYGLFAHHIRAAANKILGEEHERRRKADLLGRTEPGQGQKLLEEMSEQMAWSRAAWRIGAERDWPDSMTFEVAKAIVTLRDHPNDTDRQAAEELLVRHGLTPCEFEPTDEDRGKPALYDEVEVA